MNFPKLLPLSILSLALTACGGGGGSEGEGEGSNTSTNEPEIYINQGGTASSPSQIDFENLNEISKDEFDNYFKVSVQEGDELIIKVALADEIDIRASTRCSGTASIYTGIRTNRVGRALCVSVVVA